MNAAAARSDRAHAVRSAARDWKSAGILDDAGLARVEALYPDDRVRSGWPLRVLVFLFAFLAAFFLFVLFVFEWFESAETGTSLLYAALLAAVTEWQIVRLRRASTGSESATALMTVFSAAFGIASLVNGAGTRAEIVLTGFGTATVSAIAAWRWGTPPLGAVSAVSILVGLHAAFHGRAGVALGGAVLAIACWRASTSKRFPPATRDAFGEACLVGLVALYLALDKKLVDLDFPFLYDRATDAARAGKELGGGVATALLSGLVLFAGVRLRDKRLLTLGALFTAVSLYILRLYHPVLPAWLALTQGGAASIAAALGIRHWLGSHPAKEFAGFTSEPLFESSARQKVAEAAVALAMMTPSGAHPGRAETFEGGGGESGGGGASGGY